MSKQKSLPAWYRFFIDDLIDLRAMNHPDDIHYKAARMDGYISGLLMSNTITANECDQLRTVLDNAESYARAEVA